MDNDANYSELWQLVTHWERYRSASAGTVGERRLYQECAKQLRFRINKLENKRQNTLIPHLKNLTITVLDSLIESNWIERYTLVDYKLTLWHSSEGKSKADEAINAIFEMPGVQDSCELLANIYGWLAAGPDKNNKSVHDIERLAVRYTNTDVLDRI